jgi:hypothetical protein
MSAPDSPTDATNTPQRPSLKKKEPETAAPAPAGVPLFDAIRSGTATPAADTGPDGSPAPSPAPTAASTSAASPAPTAAATTDAAATDATAPAPETPLFFLYVADEVQGPFTAVDIEAFIAAGQIAADTSCMSAGSQDPWQPAAKFFKFPKTAAASASAAPRIMRVETVAEDERESQERPELSPLLRKRLIQLGLASATTIDSFTEEAALSTLAVYEEHLRSDKKKKWLHGAGAFSGAVLLALLLYTLGPVAWLSTAVAGIFTGNDEKFFRAQGRIAGELKAASNETEKFADKKNTPTLPVGKPAKEIIKRPVLVIPKTKESVIEFKVNFEKFLGAGGAIVGRKPAVVYLKKSLQSDQQKKAAQLAELVWKYTHPENLRWKFKTDESGKSGDLIASWKLFRTRAPEEFSDFIAANEQSRIAVPEDALGGGKSLRIDGARTENLVAVLEAGLADSTGGITLCFPARSTSLSAHSVTFSTAYPRRTTDAEALEFVNFFVAAKETRGGKPYGVTVIFQGKTHFIHKLTAPLHYLGVLCEGSTTHRPVWLEVSQAEFAKFQIGDKILAKNLLGYKCHTNPEEPKLPSVFKYKPAPPPPPRPAAPPAAKPTDKDGAKTDAGATGATAGATTDATTTGGAGAASGDAASSSASPASAGTETSTSATPSTDASK